MVNLEFQTQQNKIFRCLDLLLYFLYSRWFKLLWLAREEIPRKLNWSSPDKRQICHAMTYCRWNLVDVKGVFFNIFCRIFFIISIWIGRARLRDIQRFLIGRWKGLWGARAPLTLGSTGRTGDKKWSTKLLEKKITQVIQERFPLQ